jgi:hypothetical protein
MINMMSMGRSHVCILVTNFLLIFRI